MSESTEDSLTTSPYTKKINMVLGAILCGRCVCGERLQFDNGEIYKCLPDVNLEELVSNITAWLESGKETIDKAVEEYINFKSDITLYQYRICKFQDEITGDTFNADKMYELIEELRELIPILVKMRDDYESSHLTCMIYELK